MNKLTLSRSIRLGFAPFCKGGNSWRPVVAMSTGAEN